MTKIRNRCAVFDCRKDSVTNFGVELRGLQLTLWFCELHRKAYSSRTKRPEQAPQGAPCKHALNALGHCVRCGSRPYDSQPQGATTAVIDCGATGWQTGCGKCLRCTS